MDAMSYTISWLPLKGMAAIKRNAELLLLPLPVWDKFSLSFLVKLCTFFQSSKLCTFSRVQNYAHFSRFQNYAHFSRFQNYARFSRFQNYARFSRVQNYARFFRVQNYARFSRVQNYAHFSRVQNYAHFSNVQNYAHFSRVQNNAIMFKVPSHVLTIKFYKCFQLLAYIFLLILSSREIYFWKSVSLVWYFLDIKNISICCKIFEVPILYKILYTRII